MSLWKAAEKLLHQNLPDVVRGDILLEELFLALGVLGGVLLERLILDQTHVGTDFQLISDRKRGLLTGASSKSWW